MKTIIAMILLTAAISEPASRSHAQTVRGNSGGEYFQRAAETLCGSRVRVNLDSDGALVYLSGEYLQNRNLDEVARNLALDGLNAFPESQSFSVWVEDSKGKGYAKVKR